MPASSRPSPLARLHGAAAAAVMSAVLAACSGATPPASGPAASATGLSPAPAASSALVLRDDDGSTLPGTAPGNRLGLWHYTIPAGAKLAPHYHPGWQVARITAGTLTYTVMTSEATVIRGGGTQELHGPGETITLAAGDTIIESPDLHHYASNDGTAPVEIYSSSLFTDGSAPAILLPSPGPSPTP